jgi:hypothetical protein
VDEEYPIPSDNAVPYPVDVVYPVCDAYAYPDMDGAYGCYEEMNIPMSMRSVRRACCGCEQDKKKFDGDTKVVIGLVPSTMK